MTALALDLCGADVLLPEGGLQPARLSIADGMISGERVGRSIDLSGFQVLPGIIDLHGDGFERHLAPRRGAMKEMDEGVVAAEAEFAANGITTAVMAQFYSWEGGLRGPEFAAQVFEAIQRARRHLVTCLIAQLRFETHMLNDYEKLPGLIAAWDIGYVVFNDHLPHDRLALGKKPPRLTGQALKAGRNPERHLELLQAMHAQSDAVPAALDQPTTLLARVDVRMGSHDEQTAAQRARWRSRGVVISEFPETVEAAEAAHAEGDPVVLGAPNVVRGGSHKGNANAVDLIRLGLCDAVASDYHYPSLRRAALMLVRNGICDFASAWSLISGGPAKVLGLSDRGHLGIGKRADMTVLNAQTGRVAATICSGRISYMNGDVAARFIT